MKDKAYAKVNLALDVFRVRENGYHDIRSIMVPISLYDELEMNLQEVDSYECNMEELKYDEHNSIYKMIKAFHDFYKVKGHYEIKLNKKIPAQAGLAGGTSDAASALRLLQKLHNISSNKEEIQKLCVQVGADVYFNYYNKPSLVEGIGDKLTFITIKKEYSLLLIKPNSGVSTKEAYELLDMEQCDHPDVNALMEALKKGDDIEPFMSNSLEQPAFLLNKEIEAIKKELLQKTNFALMSGSGSTVFTISKDKKVIDDLYDRWKDKDYFVEKSMILC